VSVVVVKPSHRDDANGEPTPAFASDAEIELAAQLRHKLEARLLETSVAPSSSKTAAADTTDTINSSTRRGRSAEYFEPKSLPEAPK
jgi:hypothetical protein